MLAGMSDPEDTSLNETPQRQPAPQVYNGPRPVNVAGIAVSGSRWVATLHLLDVVSDTSGPVMDIPSGVVNLSWPLAKALHVMLGDVIGKYEEVEGTVALPRTFRAPAP